METTKLIPVAEWKWNLYKAVYTSDEEGTRIICEKWFVETDTHIEGSIEEHCPRPCWWTWKRIKENVPPLKPIGNLYGVAVHGSSVVDPKNYGL